MRVFSLKSNRLFFLVTVIVYTLKIIGLAPFTVPMKASRQINSWSPGFQAFQYSKIGLVYNILLLIPVSIVAALFYFPYLLGTKDSKESSGFDPAMIIYTTESILFIISACVVIVSWGCRQKDAAAIMNRVLEIDVRLSTLKEQPLNKRALIFFTIHVILNAFLWITFWARRIVYYNMDNLLPTFFSKLPDYIIYCFIIEYFIVVSLLAQYIETVNKCLISFNEFGNYLSRPRITNGSLLPVASVSIDHNGQLSSLQLLHSIRTMLYELCGDISDFFSLPILFCITCCFVPLVRELYVVSMFTNNTDVSFTATASYIFLIIFLYVYPVVSLALNVTRVGKQAKLTGNIVHKLLVKPTGREIKEELTQFSLQLLHEDVMFTAYGFFALDSKLLLSMLGGAASYFVALMQFQSACTSESSDIT